MTLLMRSYQRLRTIRLRISRGSRIVVEDVIQRVQETPES
jgi:hypothetical protein